jgi:hypothetical protein
MSDLSDRLKPYKSRAQRHKKAAVQARIAGDEALAREEFEEAHYAIDEAFAEIESRGTFNPSISGAIDQATKDQAFELADCWGIRGGIYREEGEVGKAIDAYDKGYALEVDPKYEIASTYNTVNRLVLRLLRDPRSLQPGDAPGAGTAGSRLVPELLAEAGDAIAQKWRLMTDPVWALADMVLIKTLLQAPDAAEWEARLESQAGNRFPFDSLRAVVKRLAESELPVSPALRDLEVRLEGNVAQKWPPRQTTHPVG